MQYLARAQINATTDTSVSHSGHQERANPVFPARSRTRSCERQYFDVVVRMRWYTDMVTAISLREGASTHVCEQTYHLLSVRRRTIAPIARIEVCAGRPALIRWFVLDHGCSGQRSSELRN